MPKTCIHHITDDASVFLSEISQNRRLLVLRCACSCEAATGFGRPYMLQKMCDVIDGRIDPADCEQSKVECSDAACLYVGREMCRRHRRVLCMRAGPLCASRRQWERHTYR